jgi:hypothetical protein
MAVQENAAVKTDVRRALAEKTGKSHDGLNEFETGLMPTKFRKDQPR